MQDTIRPTAASTPERGITLVEMLVAMTVFLVVLGGALGMLRSQSRTLRQGVDESGILQNLRFGAETVDQEVRTAGSNAPDLQPPVIYASDVSLAFNADYVSNLTSDISAVYIDPDAPSGQVNALTTAVTIPGSSPGFTYPSKVYQSGGTTSPAETITFFFQPDPETARTDDYRLMRQVNNGTPEPLVRNVLAYPGRPFFRYYYQQVASNGTQTNQQVATGWLPLKHTVVDHGTTVDSGVAARIDSLRAVELSYSVTNGRSGAEERIRRMSAIVPLPNLTTKKLRICGRDPIFGQAVVATPTAAGVTPPGINLQWAAAVDEAGGEHDVLRYLVWRRVAGAASWGDPLFVVPAGKTGYTSTDVNVVSGTKYDYAVAAQDCTPSISSQATVLGTTAP